jgi:hypothetical protein
VAAPMPREPPVIKTILDKACLLQNGAIPCTNRATDAHWHLPMSTAMYLKWCRKTR